MEPADPSRVIPRQRSITLTGRERGRKESHMSTIGEKLKAALDRLAGIEADARRDRAMVLTAWEEHDYEWLVEAGYLTERDVENA